MRGELARQCACQASMRQRANWWTSVEGRLQRDYFRGVAEFSRDPCPTNLCSCNLWCFRSLTFSVHPPTFPGLNSLWTSMFSCVFRTCGTLVFSLSL